MAEYIERGAVLAEMISKPLPNDASLLYFAMRGIVRKAPAADVAEVKHGEWKLMGTEMFLDGSYGSKFCCSLCSREIGVCHEHDSDKYKYAKSLYPYCHCGAKMDLKGDANNG